MTRNNILKSLTEDSGTRCLTSKGKTITWDQFWKAFNYDRGEFCMSLHHKFTEDHFQLDPASKMCNHLAEDVLDRNMLTPIKAYKSHLVSKGQDGSSLDSTIELLAQCDLAVQ
ncbi:unnamed protein product [Porites evermanni]|uniref:Uncharacterized protein n=1 Tax=Porites evermanni TaxID=104178 RepID=A0ABN8QG77_9CNID|nr:unnamed protein product [Porites evermanni]